jgi:hypothetical protein
MRPKRGCGCVVLVLAVVNFLILISLFYSIAAGSGGNIATSLLMAAVFVANMAVCVMLGLPALRRRGVGMEQGTEAAEDAEPQTEEEGEDS